MVDQPRLLFLKDTDGDDKADEVRHLLDGWATDDTHHTCGAFEWSHGGLLHMLEGIATSTTLETPWGPHRSQGSGGAYVLDPRTHEDPAVQPARHGNMWCYVFDEWGQGIVGDGTDRQPALGHAAVRQAVRRPQGVNCSFILPNGDAAGPRQRVAGDPALPGRRAEAVHLRLRHQHERPAALHDPRRRRPGSWASG